MAQEIIIRGEDLRAIAGEGGRDASGTLAQWNARRRCGLIALAEPVPVTAWFAEGVGVLGAGGVFAGWRAWDCRHMRRFRLQACMDRRMGGGTGRRIASGEFRSVRGAQVESRNPGRQRGAAG